MATPATATQVIQALADAPIAMPNDPKLLTADFVQDGGDLLLQTADGGVTIVEGYFDLAAPVDLMIGGAVVPGRVVGKLAHPATSPEVSADSAQPESHAQNDDAVGHDAQPDGEAVAHAEPGQLSSEPTGAPIAEISEMDGEVLIQHADGSVVVAEPGALLYEDDVLSTATDSSVGVTFVDGMTFSLGADARMLLDEFAYDPEGHTGGGLLSILQGEFSFVSGDAAHTAEDALMIETPTMTIGVRGTKVVSHIAAEGETSRIALLAEEDGTVGKIMVMTDAGEQLISEANKMVEVTSRHEAPSNQVEVSSSEVVKLFGAALETLPAPKEFFEPEEASADTNDAPIRASTGSTGSGGAQRSATEVASELSGGGSYRSSSDDDDDNDPDAATTTVSYVETKTSVSADSSDDDDTTDDDDDVTAAEQLTLDAETREEEAIATASISTAAKATVARQAPVLDTSVASTFSDVAEDTAAPTGNTVAEILDDNAITINGGGSIEAIALTGADTANGAWEYSLDGGSTFTTVGAVSDSAALLLDATAILRFVPNADYNGTATLTYRAWDQSSGSAGQTVNVSTNGGSTAFSSDAGTASVTVTPVNDAPVLDNSGSATLASIAEDNASSSGTTVADIVADGSITDADGAAVEAIALTGADTSNGSWEYSLDGGATFTTVSSGGGALLLDATAILRFVPNADYTGTATISYRAWDQSSGSVGQTVYNTWINNGGSTAYSTAVETASIEVTAVNDAPVLDTSGAPSFTDVAKNDAAPGGDTIADLIINGSITDADGSAAESIALTSVDDANGTWEYSLDGGTSFTSVGVVSDSSALLLSSDAILRFVPDSGYTGSADVSFRAWDESAGTEGDKVNVTTNGGDAAFSSAVETASVDVVHSNRAPVISVGDGLSFDGSYQYIDAGDPGLSNDDLDPTTGDLTVEAWFYWDGYAYAEQVIVAKGNSLHSKLGYSIGVYEDQLILRANVDGNATDGSTAATHVTMPSESGWYHVAMVIDQEAGAGASTVTGYLNGSNENWSSGFYEVQDDTFTAPSEGVDALDDFTIGAVEKNGNAEAFLDGAVSDVRVWKTARTEDEINDNMARTLNGDEENLIANWRLDEDSGGTVANSVSGGADGTVTGGATAIDVSNLVTSKNTTLEGRMTATDEDGDTLTFSIVDNGDHGVAAIDTDTGAWVYTPDSDYVGTDTISYQVSDGNGGVDTISISVTVTA